MEALYSKGRQGKTLPPEEQPEQITVHRCEGRSSFLHHEHHTSVIRFVQCTLSSKVGILL